MLEHRSGGPARLGMRIAGRHLLQIGQSGLDIDPEQFLDHMPAQEEVPMIEEGDDRVERVRRAELSDEGRDDWILDVSSSVALQLT